MIDSFRHARAAAVIACVVLAGCAKPSPLPTYKRMPLEPSLDVVRTRSAALERVSGQGTITLENPDRDAVRLDAAFALAPPGQARVRAYKFTQAVFDLTLSDRGLFVFIPRERGKPGDLLNATRGAAGAIRQWLAFFSGQIDASGASVTEDAKTITLSRPQPDGLTLTTTIDRPTLLVRSQTLTDSSGTRRFELTFDRHRDFAGTLWPARIVAWSERGTITIETGDLQPNVVADGAFTPPPRAVEVK